MEEEDREYLMRIGRRIAEARKAKNLTQLDLGSKINMEAPNISAIENGKQNITALNLKKIADALGIEVAKLFS